MSFLEIVGVFAVVILGLATLVCAGYYGTVFYEFLVLLKCRSDHHWEAIEVLQKKVDQLSSQAGISCHRQGQ